MKCRRSSSAGKEDRHKSNAGKETKIWLSHLNNHGLKEKWHNAQRRISRSLLSINRTKATEDPSLTHSPEH